MKSPNLVFSRVSLEHEYLSLFEIKAGIPCFICKYIYMYISVLCTAVYHIVSDDLHESHSSPVFNVATRSHR